jgi:hypothetical protein
LPGGYAWISGLTTAIRLSLVIETVRGACRNATHGDARSTRKMSSLGSSSLGDQHRTLRELRDAIRSAPDESFV